MTIAECLQKIAQTLKAQNFSDAQLEARFLLQEALGLSSAQLLTCGDQTLSPENESKVLAWADRRAKGEPLAYISGRRGFYKAEFLVEPGVLIPRPETEFVVTTALARVSNPAFLADFGCGSGCIGLSLLGEWPQAQLWALDASPVATRVTIKNAEHLGFLNRVSVVESRAEDWKPGRAFDVIVANPPYIAEGDPQVESTVHRFEPHLALYSGDQGFEAIRGWALAAYRHLKDGGVVVFEIGAGQSEAVQAIMKNCGFKAIEVTQDLAGIDRVVSAIKRGQQNG
jgi:release factor glutamine methyltransferase